MPGSPASRHGSTAVGRGSPVGGPGSPGAPARRLASRCSRVGISSCPVTFIPALLQRRLIPFHVNNPAPRLRGGFPGGPSGEEPDANARDRRHTVRSPAWEDPLEEGKATHVNILAWRIPGTEEPGGLQSMGLQRARHD